MALELGNLSAGIELDLSQFDASMDRAEQRFRDLASSAEKASKQKVDVSPTGEGELDQASRKISETADAKKRASSEKLDVTPTGVDAVKRATAETTNLGSAQEKAAAKAQLAQMNYERVVMASQQKITQAEHRYQALREDGSASAGELAAAESRVTQARLDGASSALRAELQLQEAKERTVKVSEDAARAAQDAAKATESSGGGGMFDGLAKSAAAALPAVSAVAAVGTTLSKGWARLESIDTATFKLQGLGHGAESVATIMDSALASVKGTAFGLGDAVTAAANAVASGVEPGQELTQVLTTMADVSAISGAELTDMGMIFNSVLAKGKLQGDDMLQLLGRGVPVLQMLGDELGVTAEEASKMASDGEISFQIFESAMRNSLGGAATEMGASMSGAMDNAGAAIGRLGAAIADPVFEAGPGIIGGFTSAVDGLTTVVEVAYGAWEKVPTPIKAVIASLTAVAVAQKALNSTIGDKFQDKLGNMVDGLKGMGDGFKSAYAQSVNLNPELQGIARGLDVVGTGAKTAGGNLMAAFGGPWGLAIAGATAAIGLFINAVQKSKEEQRAAEQATKDWANVLTEADGKITDSVQKHALLQVEQAGLEKSMEKVGLSAADVAAGMLDLDGANEQVLEHLDALIESGMKAPTAFQGRTYTDTAKAAMELKREYLALTGTMEEGQEQAEAAADAQDELADRIEQSGDAADGSSGSFSNFSDVLNEMANEAETVDEAIKILANRMMGMSGDPAVALQGYLSSAIGSIQEIGKALEGGDGGFDIDTGTFDLYTEQGRKLEGVVSGLKDEMYLAVAAQRQYAIEQGKTGVEASELATEKAAELSAELRRQFEVWGWGEEKIQAVFDTYGLAPEAVVTELKVEGAENAQALMDGIDWSMAKLDGDTSTIVVDSSSVKLTDEELEELGFKKKALGSDLIEIKADGAQAEEAITEIYNQVGELASHDNPVTLRPDVDAFARQMDSIKGLTADFITDPKEFPLVVDTEEARRALDTYKAEYVEINGMLYVEDNTPALMNALQNLGAETASLPEGNIIIHEPTDEILEMLEVLGFATTNLPDGQVLLDHNDIQKALDDMADLGFLVEKGSEGELKIDSNAVEREKEVDSLHRKVEQEKRGNVVIKDNSAQVSADIDRRLQGKRTDGVHWITYYANPDNDNYGQMYGTPRRAEGGTVPRPGNGISGFQDGGHTGYRLPATGPGTDRRDGILGVSRYGVPTAWVDGDEWVINRESSQEFNAVFEAGNRGDVEGMLRALLPHLSAYRDGGRVSQKVKRDLAPMVGTPYIFGGWSPAGVDCTGATSLAINSALGLPLFESRHATMNMASWLRAKGFRPGPGDNDDLVAAFYNGGPGGGHAALRLPDGTYVESGGNTGGGLTLGPPAGPLSGRGFTDFWHLPYSMDGSEELTGDGGTTAGGMGTTLSGGHFRAAYNPIDVKEGASGIGSAVGRSVSVGDIASNTAGGNMSVSGTTVRGMIGNQASTQLTQLAAQHGLEVQANQLLDAHTPNWDVFLKVSPATIEAFNDLGEAEANRVNSRLDVVEAEKALVQAQKELAETHSESADKVKEAREKLAEEQAKGAESDSKDGNVKGIERAQKALDKALEDVPEKAQQAAENVELAERALTQERANEKRAIQDLENAQLAYNDALISAPFLAVAGWLETASNGFYSLAESLAALNENLQYTQQLTESHAAAELADIKARQSLHDAEVAMAREKRRADGQAHDDAMAVRAAEWELSRAREEQSRITSRSASESILIAHNVEVAEAELDYQRAIAADNAMANQQSLELTTIDLEYAQRHAEIQAEALRAETERLALAQGNAKNATALETNAEGWGDVGGGFMDILTGVGKAAPGVIAALATGNPLALLGSIGGVVDVVEGISGLFRGGTKVAVSRDDAWAEFNDLPMDKKVQVLLAYTGTVAGPAAGIGVGLHGGSADDVEATSEAIQRALSMGLDISNEADAIRLAYEIQKNQERVTEIENRRTQIEIDHARARLDAQGIAWDEKNTLEELREIARQELGEQREQNKQLGDLNRALGKDTSVLMSIGGAGWGSDTGVMAGLESAPLGGFGGLTGDVVDPWSTLGMESGWINNVRPRIVMPWDDRTVTPPQGAVEAVSGPPKLADVQDSAMARYLEILARNSSNTNIDTQFTGEVTIQSKKADNLVDDLGRQLARG